MRTVIFDMDGTLCDVRNIRHYVTGERRNYSAFHRASLFCPPNDWVLDWAYAFQDAPNWSVAVVTARESRFESETRDWLAKYDLQPDTFRMRPWGDYRKDAVIKQEILDSMRSDGFEPLLAFDDNPDVIQVWRDNGIVTIAVPGFGWY